MGLLQCKDKESYHEIFQQYLLDGLFEEADPDFDGICAYLPTSPGT